MFLAEAIGQRVCSVVCARLEHCLDHSVWLLCSVSSDIYIYVYSESKCQQFVLSFSFFLGRGSWVCFVCCIGLDGLVSVIYITRGNYATTEYTEYFTAIPIVTEDIRQCRLPLCNPKLTPCNQEDISQSTRVLLQVLIDLAIILPERHQCIMPCNV